MRLFAALFARARSHGPRHALNDPPDSMGLEICLRRLGQADWRAKWPPAETALLDRYFDALLRASLLRLDIRQSNQGPQLTFDIVELMTMMVTAAADLDRLLAAWDAAADPPAAIHMAALRQRVTRETDRIYLYDAHLKDHDAAAERIGAFLARPDVDARLEAAFFAVDDPQLQTILSASIWMRSGS